MQTPFFLSTVATFQKLSPVLGTLPKGIDIEDVTIHVITAFDASATIEVGYPSDHDAYSVAVSVTTTGRKKPTLGSGVGIDATPREATAYVTGSPTAGEAVVIMDGKVLRATI